MQRILDRKRPHRGLRTKADGQTFTLDNLIDFKLDMDPDSRDNWVYPTTSVPMAIYGVFLGP